MAHCRQSNGDVWGGGGGGGGGGAGGGGGGGGGCWGTSGPMCPTISSSLGKGQFQCAAQQVEQNLA